MIIDDSRTVIERLLLLVKDLPNVGQVHCGHDYDEGEKLIDTTAIDVAVIDINLPGKNGIDLLRFIRQKNILRPVTIIMITDDATAARKNLCLSSGADYFLDKFTDFDQITEIISGLS